VAAAAAKVVTKHAQTLYATVDTNNSSAPQPHPPPRWQRRLTNVATDDSRHPPSRHLADASASCDTSFARCLLSDTCKSCYAALEEDEVDWTDVATATPCRDVLRFVAKGGHCQSVLDGGAEEEDPFCDAFDACVVWDDADAAEGEGDEGIDCSLLTECNFPGLHENFLGDGVCHDALPGCYNSAACGYDGGDCCEDSCHYSGLTPNGDDYGACGSEGYACADPASKHCHPTTARLYGAVCADEDGEAEGGDEVAAVVPACRSSDEAPYRLVQYDSWGDGWDNTVLTLTEHGGDPNDHPLYQGGLMHGAQGTAHVCLTKKEPKCYHVTVKNAMWGDEISWELRPLAQGAPVLAAGGSPADCAVAVGGELEECPTTCGAARPDTAIPDADYVGYESLKSCVDQKCVIQVGNCMEDGSCAECLQENIPSYCFANDNFNVLLDCTLCSCQTETPEACEIAKSAAATVKGLSTATHRGKAGKAGMAAVCGPKETRQGTSALGKFSQCANFDQMNAMMTTFDNDNFGTLDMFEACAHTYQNEPMHGGKRALDCMRILNNLVLKPDEHAASDSIAQAISGLVHNLYHDAESFCGCSAAMNKQTPTCSNFVNFKTLLFEAVDACRSLDAIDCAAWEEFHAPCKRNLLQKYGVVDFGDTKQCFYVNDACGGAGPFPAFRRLDCGGEIAKPAWDFHTAYSRGCGGASGPAPAPAPQTAPSTPAAASSTAKEKRTPHNTNNVPDEKKAYFSSPTYTSSDPDLTSTSESQKHHSFRNTFVFAALASAGFVFYKRRRENSNDARVRRLHDFGNYDAGFLSADGGGMGDYTGVPASDSRTFEPPPTTW